MTLKKLTLALIISLILSGCSDDTHNTDNGRDETSSGTDQPNDADKDQDENASGEEQIPEGMVLTLHADGLDDLEDLGEHCGWEVFAHPTIELPRLPKYSKEYTIELDRWNIVNTYEADNAESTTEGLNNAIKWAVENGYHRVVIPDGEYAISTAGITPQNEMALIMSEKVTLRKVPHNKFDSNIINFGKSHDIYIEGGVLIGERDEHTGSGIYDSNDEDNYGLGIYNSHHIFANKMDISKNYGDGVLIYDNTGEKFTSHIIIANSNIHHNRRQGISIVGGHHIRISHNEIHHTEGTAPQFGIDLEGQGKENADIIIDHNDLHSNRGGDIVNTDTQKLIVEYNTFSCGDLEAGYFENHPNWYHSDGPYIPWAKTSQLLYKNVFKDKCLSSNGYFILTTYGKDENSSIPNFFIENEIIDATPQFRDHNSVCIDHNIIRNAMCYIFSIPNARIYDNKVVGVPGCAYPVQSLMGKADNNMKCPKTEEECSVVESLNGLNEEENLSLCPTMF